MDVYLALPSLFIDTDTFRRTLYGKAGAHRLKQYGINAVGAEYRTLGPWWVDPKYGGYYVKWVFENVASILENIDYFPEPEQNVEIAINTHNLDLAAQLMHVYGVKHVI
jgi:hypothetical protein